MSLPHRFREESFRRYENVIARIVGNYPFPVEFQPGLVGLSTTTFSCRLRDAMRSLHEHRWHTKLIPMDVFDAMYGKVMVSERGGHVICGSAENVRGAKETVQATIQPIEEDKPFLYDDHLDDAVWLLGRLAHEGLLNRPVRFRGGQDTVNLLTSNFDVSATLDGEGYITLL